jgi:hypothetical protein
VSRAIPPRSAASAAASIAARRAMAEDQALEVLPDDPAGVVHHILTHRKVPVPYLCADALDGLAVIRALRADLDRDELSLIRMARGAGASWQGIAHASGITSRQGAEQRALRLEAERAGGQRLEPPARHRRRSARREEAWLRRNTVRIRQTATEITATGTCLPAELGDTIDGLAAALADPEITPAALMGWLSVLTYEARQHSRAPRGQALDRAAELVLAWQAMR